MTTPLTSKERSNHAFEQRLYAALEQALLTAWVPGMAYSDADDRAGYMFLDLMSDPGTTVDTGRERIKEFSEAVCSSVLEILDLPPDSPPETVVPRSKFDHAFELLRAMDSEGMETLYAEHFGYRLEVRHAPAKKCGGCGQVIDPDCCGCGTSREYHGSPMDEGHGFIPTGCDCSRASPETTSACQHDLQEPNTTVCVIAMGTVARCNVCRQQWEFPLKTSGESHD